MDAVSVADQQAGEELVTRERLEDLLCRWMKDRHESPGLFCARIMYLSIVD